jgi:hypothetical protein
MSLVLPISNLCSVPFIFRDLVIIALQLHPGFSHNIAQKEEVQKL